MELPSGTVTMLFTDIEGSTALAHELGDQWLPVLDRHHALIRDALDRFGGYEVKTEGDAFFATFVDPIAAVEACVAMQRALGSEAWEHGEQLKVRMGLHRGPVTVMENENHYAGVAVHHAARIGAAANGGQIIVSDAVLDAVGSAVADRIGFAELGAHGLKDFAEPVPLFQVTHPDLPDLFPPLRSLSAVETSLPTMPTTLIGRDELVSDLVRLLRDEARLVTLTGAGGIGKSRLSIEVGHRATPWFRNGVWFVPLVAATTGDELIAGICRVLGLSPQAQDPTEALIAHLGNGKALLVLDNLEQLGDDVALLAQVLAECPSLRILATSRSRLRLRGERRVEVEPLDVPTNDDQLSESSTGELLLERLGQLGISELSDDDTTAATSICRAVAGIPLAVELAAARAADIALSAIAQGLAARLDMLSEGDLDLLPHQRAMRSAIQWSVDLVADDDRAALVAIGAFAGDVDAVALAAVLDVSVDAAAGRLETLQEASLVRRRTETDPEGRERYWLLEPLRQFARDQLDDSPLTAPFRKRFWAAMTRRGVRYEDDLTGAGQVHALEALDADVANLEATVRDADADTAARLAAALVRYWTYAGRWRDGRALLLDTWERGGGNDLDRAKVGMGAGHLSVQVGDLETAAPVLEAASEAATRADAKTLLAPICNVRARLALTVGEQDQADFWWHRASEAADNSGDARTIALVAQSAAAGLMARSRFDEAMAQLHLCQPAQRTLGDVAGELATRQMLATCQAELGEPESAIVALEAALQLADRTGAATAAATLSSCS